MKMNWMQRCAGLPLAGAVFVGLGGCSPHDHSGHGHGHSHSHGHSHPHGDETRTAQITVWGERHEIFAEHRLLVAGAPTKFTTHVTDLKTLGPRREGPVRFRMQLGQEAPLERVEMAPTRAGIYEVTLTFPKAGEWSVVVFVPTAEGEKAVAIPGVRVYTDAHEAAHAEVPDPPEGITFLKEQQWKILAGAEPAIRRKLVEQLRLPATVAARPGSVAQVTPPVAGRLLLPPGQPMPLVGDKVEAEQTLAFLQPVFSEMAARLVEAEGEVARAKLAREQADLAFQRVAQLARAEAKSGRELQEAEFALKTAQARLDAALALQATYQQVGADPPGQHRPAGQPTIELRSPIAGTIIHQSGAAIGEYITADRAIFTVLDAATVFVEAQVPEAGLKRLGTTRAARYELPGEPGRFLPITGGGAGRFVFLGLRVDAATRTVPLVHEVMNPDQRLRVGQSVNLYVETDRVEDALAIPNDAIVEEGGRPIAFVQVGGETFQKRDLALGIRDGDWVQVVTGIAEGERVVTRGAYAVRLASISSLIPAHGHAH